MSSMTWGAEPDSAGGAEDMLQGLCGVGNQSDDDQLDAPAAPVAAAPAPPMAIVPVAAVADRARAAGRGRGRGRPRGRGDDHAGEGGHASRFGRGRHGSTMERRRLALHMVVGRQRKRRAKDSSENASMVMKFMGKHDFIRRKAGAPLEIVADCKRLRSMLKAEPSIRVGGLKLVLRRQGGAGP